MSETCHETIKWQVSQLKGSLTGDALEGDNFTCVEYNDTGELLAVGDKGGRITVFKQTNRTDENSSNYDIYCAFTSHEPEFDYLKSLEIEEKINSITWLPKLTSAHHLLSANDKTVKLWRLSERQREAYNFNTRDDERPTTWMTDDTDPTRSDTPGPPIPHLVSSQLRVPRFRTASHLTVEARPRRVFANAHTYHINAVSLNSDQETFLSSDDLRINLWHLDVSDQSFTIVDLKPSNMEDLSEVITCARFHPAECHLLAYSTSRGVIRLCDMRVRALCDNHILAFEDPRLAQNLGFFADIIASLSDFRFGHSGHHVLARDYLTLKVWDLRMSDQPCEIYPVHEPFRSQLCMLYENDAIFDKFLCYWSSDDRYLLTGSYGNLFRIFDRTSGADWLYDLNDSTPTLTPDPSDRSPHPLLPKQFLSPEDPWGSCLGLTTVCVASIQSLNAFLLHTDSSDSSSSSSSSPGSCFSDGGTNEDSRSPVAPDRSADSHSLALPLGDEDKPSGVRSPPTGSKRRKQVLSTPMIRTDELGDSELDRCSESRRLRRRKRRLCNNPNELNASSNIISQNGSNRALNMNPNSASLTEQRIRKKLARRQLFLDDYPTNGFPSVPDLQQLDCQRKLLHLAWHPHELKLTMVSGNQMFLVNGSRTLAPASASYDVPAQHEWHLGPPEAEVRTDNSPSDIDSTDNLSHNLTDFSSGTDPGLVLDAKAPKRPRRRSHNQTAHVDTTDVTPNSAPSNLSTTEMFAPIDTLPGVGEMLHNGLLSSDPQTGTLECTVDPVQPMSSESNLTCDVLGKDGAQQLTD